MKIPTSSNTSAPTRALYSLSRDRETSPAPVQQARLADHLPDAATIQRRATDIFTALLDGSLKIEIAGRYTLDNVEAAHAALEERRTVGKPVLVVREE